jgi:hypothetical protein
MGPLPKDGNTDCGFFHYHRGGAVYRVVVSPQVRHRPGNSLERGSLVVAFLVRIALFLAALILSMTLFSWMFDFTPRCESGWRSPSIGTQGACSHHGGIASTGWGWALLASIGLGVLAYHMPAIVADLRRPSAPRTERAPPAKAKPPIAAHVPTPQQPTRPVQPDTRTKEEIRAENARYAQMSADHIAAHFGGADRLPVQVPPPAEAKKRALKRGRWG